jgi:hypothetical protein
MARFDKEGDVKDGTRDPLQPWPDLERSSISRVTVDGNSRLPGMGA